MSAGNNLKNNFFASTKKTLPVRVGFDKNAARNLSSASNVNEKRV